MVDISDATPEVYIPCGRLSLLTGVAVHTTDQLAKTALFYVPFLGNMMPGRRGTRWTMEPLSAELTMGLDSTSGHTGYHQAGKNYDVYHDMENGRICTSPAWTSDTARADALSAYSSGLLMNNASIVVRFGTNSGDTVTIAASKLLYLGTFRASADGQTEFTVKPTAAAGGTNNKLYLWNMYNRRLFRPICRDSADTWTLASGTVQSMNASNSNRISFVSGLEEDEFLSSLVAAGNNNAGGGYIATGVGYDVTNAITGRSGFHSTSGTINTPVFSDFSTVAVGHHFFQAVESHQGGSTAANMFGDSGLANIQTGLRADLWM